MCGSGVLAEIAGLPAVSLQPAAGSHGELTGLMLIRAYFADRGEDAARHHGRHGPRHEPRDGRDLPASSSPRSAPARAATSTSTTCARSSAATAGLMITIPCTLGLFDENILEVTRSSTTPAGFSTTTART